MLTLDNYLVAKHEYKYIENKMYACSVTNPTILLLEKLVHIIIKRQTYSWQLNYPKQETTQMSTNNKIN
jgi:hypothetical protein